MTKKTLLPRIEELSIKNLCVPEYYHELFPLPRNHTALKSSIMRRGFLTEHPIVVRPRPNKQNQYEIVAGVGRWEVMLDLERETIPAVVKELTDAEARAYTSYDNLQVSNTSTPPTVVHSIILALDYAEHSKTRYKPELVLLATKTSLATHRRAKESLDYAVEALRLGICKDLANASSTKIVAESVKRATPYNRRREYKNQQGMVVKNEAEESQSDNIKEDGRPRWIDFEKLYTGELPINSFRNVYYVPSEQAKEHRREQSKMVAALSGKKKGTYKQSCTLLPAQDAGGDIHNFPVHIDSVVARLTETEVFTLVARLAADLPQRVSAGKNLPSEFAEIFRTAKFNTGDTYSFCHALTKYLKPPAKTATPVTQSLFDLLPTLPPENSDF